MKYSIISWLLHNILALAVILVTGAGLTACGGGESTAQNPNTAAVASTSNYIGPPPATTDVQAFKLNVWDNLSPSNRCGECHVVGGSAPILFVRSDDINLAYTAASGIVDLATPANSTMVSRVGNGHNCWLGSDQASTQACAGLITAYITAWAGGGISNGTIIQLTPPNSAPPTATLAFPPAPDQFRDTVYPVLTANCTECHTDSAATPQSPFFANADPASAYDAAKPKIDLNNPAISRLVVRLRDEFHNCWDPFNTGSSDCDASSTVMENAIIAFAGGITVEPFDTSLVTSEALTLLEGIVASNGNRFEDNVIARYEFKEGDGSTAFDTSGVAPDMHLALSGDIAWIGGGGIMINSGKAQATTATSKKLHDMIKVTGEYTVEAWVVPGNVAQEGPARIISYSASTVDRNFMLGQTLYNYDFYNRNTDSDSNGGPSLSTADADEDLQATLQHVVLTYDPVNGRRIYVNGVFTDDVDTQPGSSLNDWDNSFAFVLGNEVSSDRQWQGSLRMVAIHNRALTDAQILQNFDVGVGEKFFLLFRVDAHSGISDSYVLFEVSQYDSYGYLFNAPRFIVLDPNVAPDSIPVAGMRIGVNGKEAAVGQAYKNLNTSISSALYVAGEGQPLSDLGTIIALENGPNTDEFFLSFEVFGNSTNVVVEADPQPPAAAPDLPETSDIGLRNFHEINASMAAITGVSPNQVDVEAVYATVKQQLPSVENIEGFLSAHQMAVSQMAIEYCSALVDNNGTITRESFFPGFFTSGLPPESADTAFDTPAKRDMVIIPLITRVMNTGLTVQPDTADVTTEVGSLMQKLSAPDCAVTPPVTCASIERTEQIVKASCAALLGSAAMLLQ
jgi:hypothetical protein